MATPWSESDIADLKRMWDAGDTGRTIAEYIGVSRSAVLGQVHRLGLKRAPDVNRRNRTLAVVARNKLPKQAIKRAARPPQQPVSLAPAMKMAPLPAPRPKPLRIRPMGPVTLFELREGDCRWPTWKDGRITPMAEKIYCGQPALEGQSWCKAHCAVVYQPRDKIHPHLRAALKVKESAL